MEGRDWSAASEPADLGERVRGLRVRLGLSQEAVGQRLGVSFATINRWERGRTRPSPEHMARLEDLVRAGGDAGPFRSGRPDLRALPPDRTSFIGREKELLIVQDLWSRSRVLTITGPGGMGKTRLAIELLRRSGADVLGVVQLDAVERPEMVRTEIAVGLRDRIMVPDPDDPAFVRELGRIGGVLLLDTCERVIPAVAEFAEELLAVQGSPRLLLTSQVVLSVPGETVFRLAPLSTRPGGAASNFFIRRAAEHRPGFADRARGSRPVDELCRRLDGSPLALELAAAWMPVLTPEELLARWDARSDLLIAPRAPHQRHRSPAALVAWSADLLSASARGLAARLSVFGGLFTIEDAETVADRRGSGLLQDIRELVDASWLQFTDGELPHYRMLEVLRERAAEMLGAAAGACRRQVADHVLKLAHDAERDRFRADLNDWPRRLELERSTMRGVLSWAADHDPVLGARLVASLLGWWRRAGRIAEGRHWSAEFSGPLVPAADRDRAVCAEALLAMDAGDYAAAQELAARALPALEARSDWLWSARALTALSSAAKYRDNYASARRFLEKSLVSLTRHGDQQELAGGFNNLGALTSEHGELDAARSYYSRSLELKKRLGDSRSIALTMANLGDVSSQLGQYLLADELLTEALDVARSAGDVFLATFAMINLGEHMSRAGRGSQAAGVFREARDSAIKLKIPRLQALSACGLGRSLAASGDRSGAMRMLRESRDVAESMGDEIVLRQVRIAFSEATGAAHQVQPPRQLTLRELDVVGQLLTGRSNKEIAASLRISSSTVQRHLSNVFRKLGVRNRTQAVRVAHDLGLRPASW